MGASSAYSEKEIGDSGKGFLYINNFPIEIWYNNCNLANEPLDFKHLPGKDNEECDESFFKLSSHLSILFSPDFLIHHNLKKNDLSCQKLGLIDRVIDYPWTNTKGGIAISNTDEYDTFADLDFYGFVILWYTFKTKIEVSTINNSFYHNKLVIRSYEGIEDNNPPFIYHTVGSHICDLNLSNKSNNGTIALIKDLLLRIMTLTDVPMITECGKKTNFKTQALQVACYDYSQPQPYREIF
jgi:hypothetical protein